jgi:hypothetical protein
MTHKPLGAIGQSRYWKSTAIIILSHNQYECGSIIKFIEQTFNLPPLGRTAEGYTDRRANSVVDSFDFTQAPRTFSPIPIPSPYAARIRFEPPSNEPIDNE